jgi:hypothetical protein
MVQSLFFQGQIWASGSRVELAEGPSAEEEEGNKTSISGSRSHSRRPPPTGL